MDNNTDGQIVALLTEVQSPLRFYVQSLMPGDPNVQDVVQHANATLWQKRAEFTLGTNFKAWAFSIARFEVLNYRKQQARDARFVFQEDLQELFDTEIAEYTDEGDRREKALKQCLGKLRDQDRALLMHRYSKGGKLEDFAQEAGRSIGGLKVTLHRLRSALLECVQKQLKNPETTA